MEAQPERNVLDHAWEASVSDWVDGQSDMRAEELDTPYGRQVWDTYHLIGDVMRSEDLAIEPSPRFYARLSAALDTEPPIVAPVRLTAHRRLWRMGLSGVAMAAAVASVVWIVQPGSSAVPAAGAPPVMAQLDEHDGADPGLSDYMAAHQAMAGAGPVRQVSFDGMGSR